MIERRNFYRILHVQPDAPMPVISESYRVLMQKIKKQPVLDSPDWNVSLLNIAFNTLRDPRKRAMYDRELLKRYHIKTLSQGALGARAVSLDPASQRSGSLASANQRNYYRILQVQPDAPLSTIAASYQALRKNSLYDKVLLDEAYRVLSNPVSRKRYDLFLASDRLNAQETAVEEKSNLPEAIERIAVSSKSPMMPYRAVITHFCAFCKTPYVPQTGFYPNDNCLECASPLAVLQPEHPESPHRTLIRINVRGQLMFYLFWPGRPCHGIFQDLSPAGIRFLTNVMLTRSDIIKIDAPNFQAVAEVTHTRRENDGFSIGTRFIAARFDQRHGNFVTLRV